jgi:Fe2+ or Zn2+ uptake regulation protein
MSRLRGKKQYDIVTIYRNMSAFVSAGLVGDVDLGTGKVLYEFKGEDGGHHHHVICESCLKIEPLDVCGLEPHIKMLQKMGYKRLSHRLQFSGLCKACG